MGLEQTLEGIIMDSRNHVLSRRREQSLSNIRSRSGSMLILVLVILAVSLILITSAFAISMASRERYYKNSEQDQASLTAMSAARLIGQAAAKGAISIADLEGLAANGYTVNISASGIPGLAGSGNSNTTATFSNTTKDSKNYIAATVTTTLDADITGSASVEQVTVLLEKITIESKAFNNLLTVGIEEVGTNNNFYKMTIGSIAGSTAPVVLHGNVIVGDSAVQTFYNDMIFTGHVAFASGTDFYGNLIFYGDNASIETGGTGHGLNSLGSNVFFLRDTQASVFTNSGVRTLTNTTNIDVAAGAVYLANSIFTPEAKDVKDIADGIVLGPNSQGSSGYVPTAQTITDITAIADTMTTNILSAVSRKVLTTDQARSLFPYQTSSAVMSNAIPITPAQLSAVFTISAPGSYYINLLDTIEIANDLTLDLANGSITVYLIDTSGSARKLEIDKAKVRFINGSATNVGKILMLNGADIKIGPKNSAPEMGLYGSANHSTPPYLFVYGLGEAVGNPNIFTIENGTFEGYLGLYGTTGKIVIESAPTLYARYEAAFVDNQGSQNTPIPNCPPPAGATGGSLYTYKYITAGYIAN